jgi:hypothetical protein
MLYLVPYLSWLAIIILSVISVVLYFIPLREVRIAHVG